MRLRRREFLQLAAGAAALPAAPRIARAQTYPARPIRWIVGFAAGGAADTMVRVLGAWLSERLGQPVVVENKPGAATNISIQDMARSPPDGYTLALTGSSTAINASLYRTPPFNALKDIAPVAGLVTWPMVLEAHPSLPAKSVAELIALAKSQPGKLNMASSGTGTPFHIAGELFKMMAGIDMVHVPYRSGAQMVIDLLAGQMQLAFDVLGLTLPHIRSGELRALAMAGKDRFDGLPDVPTVAETVPGYEATVWGAVAAPRGTPHEIIELLNREINAGLASPAIKARLAELTAVPLIFAPDELTAYFAAEVEKWAKVVNALDLKLD